MSYKKDRKPLSEPEIECHPDVIYLPCKCCGSLDYDYGDEKAEVDEKGCYEPNSCDVCAYGNIKRSSIWIH